jgi:hypothetical protein
MLPDGVAFASAAQHERNEINGPRSCRVSTRSELSIAPDCEGFGRLNTRKIKTVENVKMNRLSNENILEPTTFRRFRLPLRDGSSWVGRFFQIKL